jgi:hypothetical protein
MQAIIVMYGLCPALRAMMHDPEKSDPAIVAEKPTNKAELSAADSVEPRVGPRGR